LIQNEAELEELLSKPSPEDVEAMKNLNGGDLMLLGVAGKMGPTLAMRAKLAMSAAGSPGRVIGVSRFSDKRARKVLDDAGVITVEADLLDRDALCKLPDAANIIYLAGRKFGSTGAESLTWAMNVHVPMAVLERFRAARFVALSSGNIYPFVPVVSGGATESTPLNPVGEYAQSVLGRERTFEHAAAQWGTRSVILRLNYAVELRYGVLLDIGQAVFEGRPVDLRMGAANVIWQGDANSVCLRAFDLASAPPYVLNLTGPETLSVRHVAGEFGRYLGIEPVFEGEEGTHALLNNASRCHRLFGYPTVTPAELIERIAEWLKSGGTTHGKPTHFEARDGKF
jgi:nucleoside-diphosphate-sugar epimerase